MLSNFLVYFSLIIMPPPR